MKVWPYPAVFAHRCGGVLAPENTLEGLDIAAQWCGAVEFDVMLSADGTPHLFHDECLDRTTNGAGPMSGTSDSELAMLDAGGWFHPRFRGLRVPTLAQAIDRVLELRLAANIEVKPACGFEAETGTAVARAIAETWPDTVDVPLLSSFSEVALEAARLEAPALPRGLLVETLPADWRARCARLAVQSLHLHTRRVSAADVAQIRAEGLNVVLYTENEPRRAGRRFDWGVDAIVTDRPDRVCAPRRDAVDS